MAEGAHPVYAATIGTQDLERSIEFYRNLLGFEVADRDVLGGRAFALHWNVPEDARAEVAVLADRWRYGRVVLMKWIDWEGKPIRTIPGQRCYGLINLNLYSNDIERHTARIAEAGGRPWTSPTVHDMGEEIGEPIEVMIDGPDTIILNLIMLQARNPNARVAETGAFVANVLGYNACGLTPVVTTQHCVRDAERACGFYRDALGFSVRIDTILRGDLMERFMGYPPGAMTRDIYLFGQSIIGKIAVNQPLNFSCTDLVPDACPPNYGYMAQSLLVDDLLGATEKATRTGAALFSPPVEIALPGLGKTHSAVLRNPGSGALQELIQVT
jgi:catechol 2,3-dioxygenase-like lactoylglutathione lyase family enzyme